MPIDSKRGLSRSSQWKGLAVAIAALMTVGFGSAPLTRAHDATPEPTAACNAPAFDAGSGTPVAMDDIAGMASPAATDEEAVDEGTPAEGATADAIIAAAENVAACVNSGNAEGAVMLMTDNLLIKAFGSADRNAAVQIITGLQFGELELDSPMTYADGSVSIDATYYGSKYQIIGETWYLVQDGDYWKVDDTENFTPDFDGDSASVGVHLTETKAADGSYTYAITPNTTEIVTPEVLLLHGINDGTMAHEIVVVKLPDGADPMGLLDGSIKESDFEFVGQISLQPGEQSDMVLEGLEPGTYTLVCFFTGPNGKPHAADGMVTQITLDPAS